MAAVAGRVYAQEPTMGWSSWNTYRVNISDSLIMSQAEALVRLGLDTLGYQYINIDDGYFGPRDADGQLTFNALRFPGGMKPVVDHIHSLGLKAGIYSDAGRSTCGSFWDNDSVGRGVGLYQHEQVDCQLFFDSLGFDFIKVDFCGGDPKQNVDSLDLDEQQRYTEIARAIAATGRDVRLNVCRWAFPGTWVTPIAGSWRISPDINASWGAVRAIINRNMHLSAYSSPGHYNDMDMLEVGRGMSAEEDLTHFAMWCVMGSPLMIGCDLNSIDEETLRLLKNRALVDLCRDTAQTQAYPAVINPDGSAILVRDVVKPFGTERVAALYNPTDRPQTMRFALSDIDLAGPALLTNLTEQEAERMVEDSVMVEVPAHGCRVFQIDASSRLHRTVYPAADAWLSAFQEINGEKRSPRVVKTEKFTANPTHTAVAGLGASADNRIEWRRVNIITPGEYQISIVAESPFSPTARLMIDGNPVEINSVLELAAGVHSIVLSDSEADIPLVSHLEVIRKVFNFAS